jgi:hypothetical protein
MSDIGERLDDAIDEVELNLTEDEVLSEPEEIEGDAELEERPELPEAVSEMNSKISGVKMRISIIILKKKN